MTDHTVRVLHLNSRRSMSRQKNHCIGNKSPSALALVSEYMLDLRMLALLAVTYFPGFTFSHRTSVKVPQEQ